MAPSSRHHTAHVVIVGGGITGLSAGYALQTAARQTGTTLDFTILEASEFAGGKIHTDIVGGPDGFLLEGGPDSLLTQKTAALALVHALGLGDAILPINRPPQATYVLIDGKPEPLPAGTVLGIPTQIWPFVRSRVLSPWGKMRTLLDLVLPARAPSGDESLGAVIRRRLGAEALDRLAEPLMAGIYNSRADEQSLLATFPRLRDYEQRGGSLIRGSNAARQSTGASGRQPPPPFVTLRGGMATLIDALVATLGDHLRTRTAVHAIDYLPYASQPYRVHLADGETLLADAVLLATPAYTSGDLIAAFAPTLSSDLRAIRYVSTGTVSLAYDRSEVGDLLAGFGVIIPASERRRINALTITSSKFAHRAPADKVLLRAFIGGARQSDLIECSDREILHTVGEEVSAILGIHAAPRFSRIWRMRRSSPQYDVGHGERVTRIIAQCPPGLLLAGNAYRGVGIPDCITSANDAVAHILQDISTWSLDTADR